MKVGQLTPWLSTRGGGVPKAVRPLALHLQESGIEVHIFGLKDSQASEEDDEWLGLRVQCYAPADRGLWGYAQTMVDGLTQTELSLLHTHGLWLYPSVAGFSWAKRTRRPFIVSPHGMLDPWALNNGRVKKRLAWWLYEGAHLQSAACIHALNEAESRSIRASGLSNPIAVVPNGVELPQFRPVPTPEWRESLPSAARNVLFLGRIHPKKGLRTLLRAWKLVQGTIERKDWRLVIAGWDQGGHEVELKGLVRELGMQRTVMFVGPQFGRDKARVFQRSQAFILPSLSEGLPIAVLEAWAYGLPVLMTPGCNLPEGITAGAAFGMETTPESIAAALMQLFALSASERSAMGERGRALVEARFNWPKVAEQMVAVYAWVLGNGPRPDCVITD